MKLSEKQQIFTRNVAKLIQHADTLGYGLTFGHAWRSFEEQRRLVENGSSQTYNSQHLNRMAVDFNVFIDGKLTYDWQKIKPLADYWVKLHPKNRWGGDWNRNNRKDGFIDTPHFERQL